MKRSNIRNCWMVPIKLVSRSGKWESLVNTHTKQKSTHIAFHIEHIKRDFPNYLPQIWKLFHGLDNKSTKNNNSGT
jgi:hypothetical protein